MPEVYDPTNGSRFRSRRRRKRKIARSVVIGGASNAPASPTTRTATPNGNEVSMTSLYPAPPAILKKHHNAHYQQQAPPTKDPLEFCGETSFKNDDDNAVLWSSPLLNGRKHRVVTVAIAKTSTTSMMRKKVPPTATKRKTCEPVRVAVGETPLSPSVVMTAAAAAAATAAATATATATAAITATTVETGRIANVISSSTSSVASLRYAVALDTRYLDTQEGKDDQDDFQRGVKRFLQSTFRRGLSPSVITWTESNSDLASSPANNTPGSSSSSSSSSGGYKRTNTQPRSTRKVRGLHLSTSSTINVRIRSESLVEDKLDIIVSNVNGIPIRPPINNGNTKNRSVVHLPKGLMANATWNIFGDLVKATVDHANPSGALHDNEEPLRIVIFTSGTSALLDTKEAAHKRGVDSFWDKVQAQFLNTKVQSIQIVVVIGETIIIRTAKDRSDHVRNNTEDNNVRVDSDNKENNIQRADSGEVSGKMEHEQENANNNNSNNHSDDSSDSDGKHSKMEDSVEKISETIKTMERYIERKVEADFKANRSRIQFDSKFIENYPRMNITLSIIDSTVGFHSLYQKWSRDSMLVVAAENCHRSSPTVCFQLPETTDFDACELSFLVSYKNMPFRLDSEQAKQLYVDLELLGRVKLEVLQLVPISSIDASLLYGIAIGLKAPLEDNEDEHHEKLLLVQSLFKNLAAKDCALLIRSMDDPDVDKKNFHDGRRIANNGGLFHSSEESQYFLFMPEFILSKDGPASPSNGVLHRMASVDHILEETNATDILALSHPPYAGVENNTTPEENPFSEYVEASLDCLNCSPLNPWFQDALKITNDDFSKKDPKKRVVWKEEIFSKYMSEDQTSDDKGRLQPTMTSMDERESSPDNNNIESDIVWTDESGIGSLVRESVLIDTGEEKNEKGNSASSAGKDIKSDIMSKYAKEIVDDVEYSDDDDEIMMNSFTAAQNSQRPQSKEVVATRNKQKVHREECLETDCNLSDSDSLGTSTDDSGDSSSGDSTFGKFNYGTY